MVVHSVQCVCSHVLPVDLLFVTQDWCSLVISVDLVAVALVDVQAAVRAGGAMRLLLLQRPPRNRRGVTAPISRREISLRAGPPARTYTLSLI